jgi:hypothetical protein
VKKALSALLLVAWVSIGGSSQDRFTGYVDQAPPEHTPRVFRLQTHEGFFASDRIALSADGKELYYTEVTNTWSDYGIRYYKYSNSKWNGPFDLFPGFLGPALSVDNKTMYFEKYNESRTCWQSTRTDTGWSTPTLCAELQDPKDKHYLQETASGRIYASSRGALNGIGQMDISAAGKTGAKGVFHSLGRPLNSPGNEGDFYIARDEAFIVFGSPHRGGFGGGDLFISFRESDGSWSDPKNLGATINTAGYEFGPYVTDDKRYLFYSSSSDFSRVDVYWVRFDSLLETLRHRVDHHPRTSDALVGLGDADSRSGNPDQAGKCAGQALMPAPSDPKAYLGQTPPGETPAVLAPGTISLESRFETYPTFSPDGKTLYFSVVNGAWTEGKILYAKLENGAWTKPEAAPFSDDRYINWESCISPDGKRMFFASNRPPSSGMDIWTVERTADGSWSDPTRLPDPINSAAQDGSPCITNAATLYFKSLRTGGTGGSWLYRAIPKDGAYTQVDSLGNIIKTTSGETEPFMSPDEGYLIFASETRKGGNGGWDLWICFRQKDGSWTEPVNLGVTINTAEDEYGPRVSPDGKYLLFTREKRGESMDIYWVATSVIGRLKHQLVGG